MSSKSILLIGLDPKVVNYDRWPGLTAEKLEAGLRRDEATLNENGYAASICFIDHGETAEEVVKATLAETDFACVLVGAGVRTDDEEFLLFEKLINVVHEHAPKARICFNTGPTDSVAAVERWV
ncbi:MAG: hypothetical protein QNJ00_16065 [Woeseiaceae bacterium]|nr:hypothetical protein [Woeseiaceae bacterium]